jgi:hypothetical protein
VGVGVAVGAGCGAGPGGVAGVTAVVRRLGVGLGDGLAGEIRRAGRIDRPPGGGAAAPAAESPSALGSACGEWAWPETDTSRT